MRMLLIGLVEVAEALKVAGEPTVDPFVGDVTVTPAKAAAVMAMAADYASGNDRRRCPSGAGGRWSR